MSESETSKQLCAAIRKNVAPYREVEFSTIEVGINSLTTTIIWAWVKAPYLAPIDYNHLLEAINYETAELAEKKTVIKGRLDGREYEIRLCAQPVAA